MTKVENNQSSSSSSSSSSSNQSTDTSVDKNTTIDGNTINKTTDVNISGVPATNVMVTGTTPAMGMATLMVASCHSLARTFDTSATIQHQQALIGLATTSRCVNSLLPHMGPVEESELIAAAEGY